MNNDKKEFPEMDHHASAFLEQQETKDIVQIPEKQSTDEVIPETVGSPAEEDANVTPVPGQPVPEQTLEVEKSEGSDGREEPEIEKTVTAEKETSQEPEAEKKTEKPEEVSEKPESEKDLAEEPEVQEPPAAEEPESQKPSAKEELEAQESSEQEPIETEIPKESDDKAETDATQLTPEKTPLEKPVGAKLDLSQVDETENTESEHQPPKKMKAKRSGEKATHKVKKRLIIFGIVVGVIAALYLIGVAFYHTHFFYNTNMNGFDASNKTVEEVKQGVKGNASDYQLKLEERDNQSETIKASDITLTSSNDDTVQKALEKQNPWRWPLALIGKATDGESPSAFTYNKEQLSAVISQLNAVAGASVVNAENAHPVYENGNITIKGQVTGNEIDQAALTKAVDKAIATGQTTLNLDNASCYVKPAYDSESKEVSEAKSVMEKYLSTVVTYTFGNQTEVLDKNTFGPWLVVDDQMNVVVDEAQAKAYVASLADKYDTAWKNHSFTTSSGQAITVSGGNYGWEIDEASEVAELIPLIESGGQTTREPVYAQTAKARNGATGDIGNTYVEISLSGQYMWFYKNGALVVGTPVVTGNASDGRGTPAGVYKLYGKQKNATLVGENYRTPVAFWMPFNGGIGIHDSTWRAESEYGGQTYINNGSHGCVNTPYNAAGTIFNGIEVGDPIVVY